MFVAQLHNEKVLQTIFINETCTKKLLLTIFLGILFNNQPKFIRA